MGVAPVHGFGFAVFPRFRLLYEVFPTPSPERVLGVWDPLL
jgi:hypothetical protein